MSSTFWSRVQPHTCPGAVRRRPAPVGLHWGWPQRSSWDTCSASSVRGPTRFSGRRKGLELWQRSMNSVLYRSLSFMYFLVSLPSWAAPMYPPANVSVCSLGTPPPGAPTPCLHFSLTSLHQGFCGITVIQLFSDVWLKIVLIFANF